LSDQLPFCMYVFLFFIDGPLINPLVIIKIIGVLIVILVRHDWSAPPPDAYYQRSRYAPKEARHAVVLIILQGQIKTAGETPKNAPSRLACSFVIERLPLTISDVTPREPRIGCKSICLSPRTCM